MPPTGGIYGREWRVASSNLTRALGRPIRDQVIPVRSGQASTLQALELVNGEILTRWLSRGARRMLGETPAETSSLYNRTVAGRGAKPAPFVVDVSGATRLWLIVQENGSNMPRALLPAWAQAELVGPAGAVPLSSLTPLDRSGFVPERDRSRWAARPARAFASRTRPWSSYDIAGKGFTSFRGVIGLENPPAEIGSTLDPQIRFFVFGAPPDMDRLIPPRPEVPLPAPPTVSSVSEAVDRVFRHALGRAPSAGERAVAEAALRDPSRGARPSAEGLADLLWAVTMKPEFQLVY